MSQSLVFDPLLPWPAIWGLAAFAYSLGCTEGSLTFVSIWYTAGVALATAFGALIGPRVLRW